MTKLAYADASALAKLILTEPAWEAFHRWYVEEERVATSRIGIVEADRASRRRPHDADRRELILRDVKVMEIDPAITRAAGAVQPPASERSTRFISPAP